MFRKLLIALVALFVLLQFIPVDRTNPPITQRLEAPEPVLAILDRACSDCHSHETDWPWYGYVAPASLILSQHVQRARSEMNFSAWDYPEGKARHLISEMLEEIEEGEMPLPGYVKMHKEAVLAPEDIEVMRAWVAVAGEGEDEDDEEDEGDEGVESAAESG